MAIIKRKTDCDTFDLQEQTDIEPKLSTVADLLSELISNNNSILNYLEDESTWSGDAQKEFKALFDLVNQFCVDLQPVYEEHASSWGNYNDIYNDLISSNIISGLNDA